MYNNKEISLELQKIRKDLEPFFAEYPSLEAVYLFGSVISGNAGPASGVDIAVRFVPELSPDDSFDLRLKLMDNLEEYFNRNTDVVVLNSSSIKMIRQVLTQGILLFCRDPEAELGYAIQKQKEYFDFKYYIDQDRQELKSFFGAI